MINIKCRITLSALEKFIKDECKDEPEGYKIRLRLVPLLSKEYEAGWVNVDLEILLDEIKGAKTMSEIETRKQARDEHIERLEKLYKMAFERKEVAQSHTLAKDIYSMKLEALRSK